MSSSLEKIMSGDQTAYELKYVYRMKSIHSDFLFVRFKRKIRKHEQYETVDVLHKDIAEQIASCLPIGIKVTIERVLAYVHHDMHGVSLVSSENGIVGGYLRIFTREEWITLKDHRTLFML